MSGAPIRFEPLDDPPGVAILDEVERRRLPLLADDTTIESAEREGFLFPVDAATRLVTSSLTIEQMVYVIVRSDTGAPLESLGAPDRRTVSEGRYQIEVSAPIKLYLAIDGKFTIETDVDETRFSFDGPTTVLLGARSYHERPAGTVTIGDEPEDVMVAISAFSSSLKTTSPDVSFPTLRGHPPLVEIGEEIDIPQGVGPAETGVTIEVPPTFRNVFPVAPLSFYTGATVEPGPEPRLTTESGFEYRFDDGRWMADEVAAVLRHLLLFDSVVRAEGIHGSNTIERKTVEPLMDVGLDRLYGLPMHQRIEEYLSVPLDRTAAIGPRWPMTAYVPPTPKGATVLPYVVNELGIVRPPRGTRIEDGETRSVLGVPAERAREYLTSEEGRRLLLQPNRFDDSIEHVWFGEHVPVGATKGTRAAFEQALSWSSSPSEVSIAVVGTGGYPLDISIDDVDEVFEVRDDLSVDIETFEQATVEDLRDILASSYDFLHFVGQTDEQGLIGTDGTLMFDDAEEISIGAFLLDGDHTFEEALWLARNGALGGIGTVGEIERELSIGIGRWVAKLLALGYPLRAALDVVRENDSIGDQYVIVGNGSVEIAQSEASMPVLLDVTTTADRIEMECNAFPSGIFRVGSMVTPFFANADSFVGPGTGGQRFDVTVEEIASHVERYRDVYRVDGELFWDGEDALTAITEGDHDRA